MWRSEDNLGWILVFIFHVVWDEPSGLFFCGICQASWLTSSQDPPVSTSCLPVVGCWDCRYFNYTQALYVCVCNSDLQTSSSFGKCCYPSSHLPRPPPLLFLGVRTEACRVILAPQTLSLTDLHAQPSFTLLVWKQALTDVLQLALNPLCRPGRLKLGIPLPPKAADLTRLCYEAPLWELLLLFIGSRPFCLSCLIFWHTT